MKVLASCTLLVLLALASISYADPVGGPSGGVIRVQANSTNIHKVLYQGGEQADFEIAGDGDTTLNIVVRDANGNEICRTRGPGDRCRATWTPGATGFYYISINNNRNKNGRA